MIRFASIHIVRWPLRFKQQFAVLQSISAPAKSGAPLQARSDSICGAALRLALRPRIRSGAPASAPGLERSAPTALQQKIAFLYPLPYYPRFSMHLAYLFREIKANIDIDGNTIHLLEF